MANHAINGRTEFRLGRLGTKRSVRQTDRSRTSTPNTKDSSPGWRLPNKMNQPTYLPTCLTYLPATSTSTHQFLRKSLHLLPLHLLPKPPPRNTDRYPTGATGPTGPTGSGPTGPPGPAGTRSSPTLRGRSSGCPRHLRAEWGGSAARSERSEHGAFGQRGWRARSGTEGTE